MLFTTRCRPLLLALVGLTLLQPSRSFAEEASPTQHHDLGRYALFGRSHVKWDGAASMPVRGSVGSESLVEFSDRTVATGPESFVAAPIVVARSGSQLHFVFAKTFDASADVSVSHSVQALVAPILASADWPRSPSVVCNGNDLTVDSANSPTTLPPGRYGVVTVLQDQTLRLIPGGRYEMCSLRVRPGATVEAHTGNLVLLRDYLSTGARARITGSGACGARWYALAASPSPAPASAGFDFAMGTGSSNRALIQGDFFTPGRITMAQHNDYVGRFWAEQIDGFGADQVTRTLADCSAPRCGDGVLDAGEACDDGNNREGDCCTALCELGAPGAACDDGKFCTIGDTCDDNSRCVGGVSPCSAPDGDANCSESCNEDTDACNGPDPDASPCDDGIFCNGADQCAGGQCTAHAGSPCPGIDNDSNCRESCNETTRTCTRPDPVGAPCNDERFCTLGETCDANGECSGGASPCPAGDGDGNCAQACDELADACTAFDEEGAACDDGLFCTGTDRCDGRGGCQGWGDPCSGPDGDANCAESCDEAANSCTASDMDGALCSDGLACTLRERCLGGTCTPSGETTCDDGNPCTNESCAPDGSCLRDYNSSPCDDGNACTVGDHCIRGECSAVRTVDCRDNDLCSADVCDPADGTCHHAYAPATSCHEMGTGVTRIDLGYSPKDGQLADRMTTSWRGDRNDPTSREELGDPSIGEAFSVCFYDESRGLPDLAYRLDFDPTTTNDAIWKRTWRASGLSYKLKSAFGTSQGVSKLRLGVDKKGVPVFKLQAGANSGCAADCRGSFVSPAVGPGGRLFAMEPGMTVQWVAENGACWSSRYVESAANSPEGFRARVRKR